MMYRTTIMLTRAQIRRLRAVSAKTGIGISELIRRYDVLHAGAGINGQDIARPAEFLLDSSGVVRWVNLTDDFRVRATPEQILKAAQLLP